MFHNRLLFIPVLVGACIGPAAGQTAASGEGMEFFEKKIRPVLATECYACHSEKSKPVQGGLYADSKEGLLRGGKSGVAAVVPGKPEQSLLIAALRHANKDLNMPLGKQLPPEQVEDFVEWIRMGAPDPRSGTAKIVEGPAYDWEKARKHWAFQPVRDPKPPQVSANQWSANPIDRFIKAELDRQGLRPLGKATPQALIRRLSFNLTGLAPAPETVAKLVADSSPAAIEGYINQLLASQQYGEHWGRHWLDIVRYSDTAGDASDYPAHEMYRYRNYVIRSFRDDKPFDLFIREQLAGDLLEARDPEDRRDKIIATGYIASARRFGQSDREHFLTIDDTIDNFGKAFLGLSLGCARCHDHKFDPIPTRDYYSLYGIFQSTNYAFAGMEHQQFPSHHIALNPSDEQKFQAAQKRYVELSDKIKKMRADAGKKDAPADLKLAFAEARDELERLKQTYPKTPAAYGASDGQPVTAKIHVKGDPKIEGPEAPRGFPQILGGAKVPADHQGSGRELLAAWTTGPLNPLTARVIVNRVWQWHFGKGIVGSPNDFGVRGERPAHPDLLDYLTSRFVEDGWSLKKLHKRILLSRTWQAASGNNDANAVKDARNEYYWRFDRRRLSAEEIRDTMLALAGELDSSMGGAHPFPAKPVTGFTQHRPFVADSAEYNTNRRSVYLMQQRIRRHSYMDLFDGADTNSTTEVRPVNTTALQALFLMNNEFVHQQADRLAVRAGMAFTETGERLDYVFRLLYGRAPSPQESAWAAEFLSQARKALEETEVPADRRNRQAWSSLMRVLLSSNEFFYLD